MNSTQLPVVIYLNGASSAGKTTLTHALQERLDGMFLRLGVDPVTSMMPAKYKWDGTHEREGLAWDPPEERDGHVVIPLHIGPQAKKVFDVLINMTLATVQSGVSAIVDDVAFGDAQVSRWRKAVHNVPALFVGVHCSPDILDARERARGDRPLGSARAQHHLVHQGVVYDLDVDTGIMSLEHMVDLIVAAMDSKRIAFMTGITQQ